MKREGGSRIWAKPLAVLSRYKYVLGVVLLGVVLLLWPGDEKTSGTSAPEERASETGLRQMEEAMEEILGRMQGVGRVDVMLTLQSSSELVLAEDTSLSYSGATQAPDDYQRTSDTVLDDDGVVVRQEKYPQYRGALVVCDGGGSDGVRLQVLQAVAALTGLGADRIAVVPWQSGDSAS